MGVCAAKPKTADEAELDENGSFRRGSKTEVKGEKYVYVVVGFGVSAGYAGKQLADLGVKDFDVAFVGEEKTFAYERPALSKGYLFPPGHTDKPPTRLPRFHTCAATGEVIQSEEWYADRNWTCYMNTKVTNIDLKKKIVKCQGPNSEEWVRYEKLIVCTGSKPVPLNCPGSELKNIYYLRNEEEAGTLVRKLERETGNRFQDRKLAPLKLRSAVLQSTRRLGKDEQYELEQPKDEEDDAAPNTNVVILGGGYLGVELACALAGWGFSSIHMVFMDEAMYDRLPFGSAFRAKLQAEILKRAPNIVVHPGISIDKCLPQEDRPGAVGSVLLSDGTTIETHIVAAAIGARPCGKELFAKKSVHVLETGSLESEPDLRLKTSETKDVWVCGELAKAECGVEAARKMGQHAALAAFASASNQKSPGPFQIEFPFRYSRLFEYTNNPLIWYQIGDIKDKEAGVMVGSNNECGVSGPFAVFHSTNDGRLTAAVIAGSLKEKETLDAIRNLVESKTGTLEGARKLFADRGYSVD